MILLFLTLLANKNKLYILSNVDLKNALMKSFE